MGNRLMPKNITGDSMQARKREEIKKKMPKLKYGDRVIVGGRRGIVKRVGEFSIFVVDVHLCEGWQLKNFVNMQGYNCKKDQISLGWE